MSQTHEELIRRAVEHFRQKGYVEIKLPRGLKRITHRTPDFLLIRHDGEAHLETPSYLVITKYLTKIDAVWGEAVHCNYGGFPPNYLVKRALRETLTRKDIWGHFFQNHLRILTGPEKTKNILKWSWTGNIRVFFYVSHENGSGFYLPDYS